MSRRPSPFAAFLKWAPSDVVDQVVERLGARDAAAAWVAARRLEGAEAFRAGLMSDLRNFLMFVHVASKRLRESHDEAVEAGRQLEPEAVAQAVAGAAERFGVATPAVTHPWESSCFDVGMSTWHGVVGSPAWQICGEGPVVGFDGHRAVHAYVLNVAKRRGTMECHFVCIAAWRSANLVVVVRPDRVAIRQRRADAREAVAVCRAVEHMRRLHTRNAMHDYAWSTRIDFCVYRKPKETKRIVEELRARFDVFRRINASGSHTANKRFL